jgi:gliding motility-associated-like protein
MKKIILYSVFLFWAVTVFAQSNFFNKKFTKSDYFYFNKIQSTQNNGFLIQGSYSTSYKGFLSQLDSNANVLWAKKVATKDFDALLDEATILKDGNILTCYTELDSSFTTPRRKYITKTNSTMSNIIWSLENSTNYLNIRSIQELSNGNIVIVADYQVNLFDNYKTVFTLDSNGNLIWQKTFLHKTSSSEFIYLEGIEELNDGQLLLVGGTITYGTNYQKIISKILKIDANNGTIIWQNDYKTNPNIYEYPTFMNEDKDGNLYFSFENWELKNNDYIYYMGMGKIDKDGTPIWRKNYGNEPNFGYVTTKPDGSFLANFTDQQTNDYFLNIDTDGNINSQYKDIQFALRGQPFYDQKGNLMRFKSNRKCDEIYPDGFVERRAANGKGKCSFLSNLTAIDKQHSKTTFATLSPVTNIPLGFTKKTTNVFLDLPLATENQAIKCQDTVFVNRCEGDLYSVGSSQYSKDGVYVDIIKNQNCFDAIVSKLNFSKQKNVQLDTAICEGKSIKIGTKEFTQAGIFNDTLKNKFGCDSILTIQIKPKSISIAAPDSLAITQGEEVTINTTSLDKNLVYEWSPPDDLSCASCPKTIAKPSESIDYTVKGTSKDGCEAEAKVNIKVFKRGEVFIPTAFSPDDNGINDAFIIFGNEGVSQVLDYSIFDRWGNQIFNQKNFPPNDASYGWNGKYRDEQAQQGVYVYKIQVKMANGKVRDFSGDVMIK